MFLLFVLLTAALATHEISENDLFWHIKTGEVILQSKSIPTTDRFSHTIAGKPWLNAQWLADATFFAVYRLFNLNGVIIFTAGLTCLSFLLTLMTFYENGPSAWLYFLIAAAGVVGSSGRFNPRPENFTVLFTALYLFVLCKEKRLLYLLPAVQLLWANMHGGFIIGLALTALFALSRLLERTVPFFQAQDGEADVKPESAFALLGAVFAASIANPSGLKIFPYVFQFRGNRFHGNVSEWRSPLLDVGAHRADVLIAVFFLLGASAAAMALKGKRTRLFPAMFLILFAALGLQAERNIPLFCAAAAVYVGILAKESLGSLGAKLGAALPKLDLAASMSLAALFLAMILALATNRYARWVGRPENFGLGVSDPLEPVGACRFIERAGIWGNMFNDYDFGGYLIFALYPKLKVFIDGRTETYGDEFCRVKYQDFWYERGADLKALVDKYKINFCVLKMGKEQPLASRLLEKGYFRIVYYDAAAVVLLKDSPENKELVVKYAVDFSKTREPGKPEDAFGLRSVSKLLKSLSKSRAMPLEEFNLGNFYQGLGQFELARLQYEKGSREFPENEVIGYLSDDYARLDRTLQAYTESVKLEKVDSRTFKANGDACLRRGDFECAAREYEKTIALRPDDAPDLYKTLGIINLFRLHDPGKAMAYFAKYQRHGGDPREAPRLAQLMRAYD